MTPTELANELDKKVDDACIFPYEVVLKRNDASRISYAIHCLQKQKQQLETEIEALKEPREIIIKGDLYLANVLPDGGMELRLKKAMI